ncbi:hypothetical protein [Nocardioides taihuensis]|uniref:DUF4129 domain-containing protein n=1 Tax=Nocardioides taihuensis TaxID=1835606 RepID=A0ABW0BF87_9ACTN
MGWLLVAGAVVLVVLTTVRSLLQRPPPPPEHRPIELIATDARRLGHRFRSLPRGVSFAKFEAIRRAYDDVLAEGCAALDLPELLGVLPAGDELDAERVRVEQLLCRWGLEIDDAA